MDALSERMQSSFGSKTAANVSNAKQLAVCIKSLFIVAVHNACHHENGHQHRRVRTFDAKRAE